MDHNKLSLEYDKNLINKVLDDINMRYIVLFLYIVRNDLLKDLTDQELIQSYMKVLNLDEIYKGNIKGFWNDDFVEIFIDLGLIKNVRTKREFEQKEDDFIVKIGEETVTIEKNTIMVPIDTIFLMLKKKFKFLTRRNFNLAITRLKSVRCEVTGAIHSFIYEIGDRDYTLADDLYYIIDQFGNPYQAIKIEVTIEGFYSRFKEIHENITDFIEIFDPLLNSKNCVNKIKIAFEENKDILKFLKDEKIKLSDRFELNDLDKNEEIFKQWNSNLMTLLEYRYQMDLIDDKLLDIKSFYSGKKKQFTYLEFIEKISFNEDDIVNTIEDSLINLRKKIVEINSEINKFTKKDLKILNLDFEKFKLINSEV